MKASKLFKRFNIFVAKRLMQPINTSLIALLGAYTMLWGLWLASPFWTVFDAAPLYSKMEHFPEWAWGAFAMYAGIEIIRGVILNRNGPLKRGAFIGYFHWFIVTLMYFFGDWRSTGGITSLVICMYCFIIFLNYRKNSDYPRP